MTSPLIVLAKIRNAGGSVSVVDQDLEVSAPPGLLDDEDRSLLAKYKHDLVKVLAPSYETQEREAIQWESSAPDDEVAAALELAREEWQEYVLEDPIPCSTCGEIVAWWDSWGNRHCQACDPPRTPGGKLTCSRT